MKGKHPQPAVTAPVEDIDLPPDRHPARRPLLILLLFAMLLLAVRVAWARIADRRLSAVVADLDTRGLLVEGPLHVPTEREQKAFEYLDLASRSTYRDAGLYLAQARRAGPAGWPPSPGDLPGQAAELMLNNRLYRLCNSLEIEATLARISHDGSSAAEHLRDLLYVADACARIGSPIGIAYAAKVRLAALAAMDEMAPRLDVETSGSVDRSEVEGLIRDLLDDQGGWARLAAVQRSEIGATLHWINACRSGHRERVVERARTGDVVLAPDWANQAAAWLAAPYYGMRGARLLEAEATAAKAYETGDYAIIMERLPPIPRVAQRDWVFGADWVTREFASLDVPRAWIQSDAQTRMMSRLAAVQLAVRLYVQDHAGTLPPSLDALVPNYLPAVPADLFTPGGSKRISYVPTAVQPFVYSVGTNGTDDVAAGTWTPGPGIPLRARGTMPDLVWYVAPAPEASPSQAPAPPRSRP